MHFSAHLLSTRWAHNRVCDNMGLSNFFYDTNNPQDKSYLNITLIIKFAHSRDEVLIDKNH